MNKYQEALDFLMKQTLSNFNKQNIQTKEHEKKIFNSCGVLQKLVDRATPAKPQMRAMEGFRLYEASVQVCPCCKELIINVWTRAEYQPNYCHYCGQALDWSDSD